MTEVESQYHNRAMMDTKERATQTPEVSWKPWLAPPAVGQWISISRTKLGPEVDAAA